MRQIPRFVAAFSLIVLLSVSPAYSQSSRKNSRPKENVAADNSALSKEFRKSASLAKIAIDHWETALYESPAAIQRLYKDEVDKSVAVARADALTLADRKITNLLLKYEFTVLEMQLALLRDNNREKHMRLYAAFLQCGSHIDTSLSDMKYSGDGPCPESQ